jgi:molybdopterin adenylyltransferase
MIRCKVGIVTISDRASQGIYEDLSGPALKSWLNNAIQTPWIDDYRLIADDKEVIEKTLRSLIKDECSLIFTTGGTGPAKRDVTPEVTEKVCEKLMPGFGELMRAHSLQYVPTAILSRQTAGICEKTLIVNLPGSPKAIGESLEAIFPAIPYCIELMEGPIIKTNDSFCKAFRPKTSPHI